MQKGVKKGMHLLQSWILMKSEHAALLQNTKTTTIDNRSDKPPSLHQSFSTMNFFTILVFLLSFNLSVSQEWEGCVDPTSSIDSKVKKGQLTQVCFTTGPGGDWGNGVTYNRYSFRPVADQYSRFTVPGCE